MSNSVDPDETAHMSRLIWVYAVSKILLLSPVAVKGLIILTLHTKLLPLETVEILISRLLTILSESTLFIIPVLMDTLLYMQNV